MGIIGYGFLGRSVAALAQAVGMKVLISERKNAAEIREGRTAFTGVIRSSDVVSLHCPLTDATRNMIDGAELQLNENKRTVDKYRSRRVGKRNCTD
jgi:glycerate dehydrogenase